MITFLPALLEFPPGTTQLSFVYITKIGGVSGSLSLSLDSPYDSIYNLLTPSISLEILDKDTTSPKVLNYYMTHLDRTYLKFRISTSESVVVHYMLTLEGTPPPL